MNNTSSTRKKYRGVEQALFDRFLANQRLFIVEGIGDVAVLQSLYKSLGLPDKHYPQYKKETPASTVYLTRDHALLDSSSEVFDAGGSVENLLQAFVEYVQESGVQENGFGVFPISLKELTIICDADGGDVQAKEQALYDCLQPLLAQGLNVTLCIFPQQLETALLESLNPDIKASVNGVIQQFTQSLEGIIAKNPQLTQLGKEHLPKRQFAVAMACFKHFNGTGAKSITAQQFPRFFNTQHPTLTPVVYSLEAFTHHAP